MPEDRREQHGENAEGTLEYNYRWPEEELAPLLRAQHESGTLAVRFCSAAMDSIATTAVVLSDPHGESEVAAVEDVSYAVAAESVRELRRRDAAAWAELPAVDRLADALEYLRGEHAYCMYCGCEFVGGQAELEASCPGINDDDH